MAKGILLRSSAIYAFVILIGVLLLVNVYLIYDNSKVIERNRLSYETAENLKVNTTEILRNLHLLDMLLRSYALTKGPRFLQISDSAYLNKDTIFARVEKPLLAQQFPMESYYAMKDSINAYYEVTRSMRDDLLSGNEQKFIADLSRDPGFRAWIAYRDFSAKLNAFEDDIAQRSKDQYESALKKSYVLQIVLFLVTMPTLLFTAFYSVKAIKISSLLARETEEKNKILGDQNIKLDKMVAERTREILMQNEEISAYNEEISAQNEEIATYNEQLVAQQREIEKRQRGLEERNQQLVEAQKTIGEQNLQIQQKNVALAEEVDRQTKDLLETNLELIEHNSRLEQFAYIISHNLRAPVARLVGLSAVLEHSGSAKEQKQIIGMMMKSTFELDQVIKDLGQILRIQKLSAFTLSKMSLTQVIGKATKMLEIEIKETKATIVTDFQDIEIYSLPQYLESIVYNLLSNSIKYRHPDRPPVIKISADDQSEFVLIAVVDNGLGIDIAQNKNNLFNLYKRFHFHVEGKGLGLYLVKTQIEALGGRIEVHSEVDKGTTFVLYLKK
jgi:signal transduction histidine kinase